MSSDYYEEPDQDPDLEYIVGTLQTIEEKPNGWNDIKIAVPGKNYPVKLSTKKKELVEAARAVGESVATWAFKERESDAINPHNNMPYINRYLESVEVGATAAEQIASDSSKAAASEPVDWDAKERRDYRSRAWAQTISAFTHTIKLDEKPEDVFLRLQPFQRKVFEDICGEFAYPADQSDIPFSEGVPDHG